MRSAEIPVTECWRESYERLSCEAGLEYFPTRAYLKANRREIPAVLPLALDSVEQTGGQDLQCR